MMRLGIHDSNQVHSLFTIHSRFTIHSLIAIHSLVAIHFSLTTHHQIPDLEKNELKRLLKAQAIHSNPDHNRNLLEFR